MRNTSHKSSHKNIVLTLLVLALLALSACSSPGSSGTPPAVTGDPQLSISGSSTADTTPEETDAEDAEESNTEESDSEDTPEDTDTEEIDTEEENTNVETTDLPTKTVKEGELVTFDNLEANDPDGDEITFSFEDPLDEDGNWQTRRGDAGTYLTTITASDGTTSTTQEVRIIVESTNAAPTIEAEDVSVEEGETIELAVEVNDEDGDDVSVEFSGFMDSDTRETTADDIGTHTVTITATDGFETTTREITVTVTDVNHAPEIGFLGDITVTEGELIRIIPSATDADGDTVTFEFSEPLDEQGKWQTEDGDEGQYTILITATDGENEASREVDITVKHLNKAPELTLESDEITVSEGDTVRIKYTVSDAEGDDVTVIFTGFMTSDSYTTTYDDAGEHTVTVTADDGTEGTSQDVTIIVKDTNRAPVFDKNAFN